MCRRCSSARSNGPPAAARLPLVEGREQLRPPGGGLAHEAGPVLLGVGVRARHRLALSLRVRPLQLRLGGVAQVEGDLAEDLEAFLGGQGHAGPLDLDGPFRDLGQPPQPGDLLVQSPQPVLEPLQGVRLRVLEERGDLVQGEAQFTVEEDLLEADQVRLAVEPVAKPGCGRWARAAPPCRSGAASAPSPRRSPRPAPRSSSSASPFVGTEPQA